MQNDWMIESENITKVREFIAKELTARINNDEELKREMRSINKDMWEDVGGIQGFDQAETFMQHIGFLKQNVSSLSDNKQKILMLEKQYTNPYFCRIDFKEKNYETESFYIGIYGLRDVKAVKTLIYDWRAPISSLFYDYEPGPAGYECPSGYIEGDLTLKRQYRIENGELKLMFDSNVAIEDNILQDMLAQNTAGNMKTIVSTIQKEQNRAIRYEGKRIFVLSGPAGSGKTSIALHRAAYLLYRHRKNLKAENIALFTPNEAFEDYISTVLPELGEENIQYHTLQTLVHQILGNTYTVYETYEHYMEHLLSSKNINHTNELKEKHSFKTSEQFIRLLEQYVNHLEVVYNDFVDIKNDKIVFADKAELYKLFHTGLKDRSIAKRLAQIKFMVTTRMNEYEKERLPKLEAELREGDEVLSNHERKALCRLHITKELEEARKALDDVCSLQINQLYRSFIRDYIMQQDYTEASIPELCSATLQSLDDGILLYEDQAPMLYMMSLLGLIDPDKDTKHVIIDEAQDYSALMYKFLFYKYKNSNFAILGDPKQNINVYNSVGELKEIKQLVNEEEFEYIELNKSYRSTQEIMDFALRILPSEIEAYGRHGAKPEVICSDTIDGLQALIRDHIASIRDKQCNSIAIICRTIKDCKQIYTMLKECIPVQLVKSGNDQIPGGIMIIPSYLTKGLEFDAVLAVISSVEDYTVNEDYLLYTVCTRALHSLNLFSITGAKVLEKILS